MRLVGSSAAIPEINNMIPTLSQGTRQGWGNLLTNQTK